MDTGQFLAPATYIDSGSPQVIAFARQTVAGTKDMHTAILQLYAVIRDTIVYDPYVNFADPANFRASGVLAAGRGFCVGKSALLTASARVIGIPARVELDAGGRPPAKVHDPRRPHTATRSRVASQAVAKIEDHAGRPNSVCNPGRNFANNKVDAPRRSKLARVVWTQESGSSEMRHRSPSTA